LFEIAFMAALLLFVSIGMGRWCVRRQVVHNHSNNERARSIAVPAQSKTYA